MAWCRQATSHYKNQCWPTTLSHNEINCISQRQHAFWIWSFHWGLHICISFNVVWLLCVVLICIVISKIAGFHMLCISLGLLLLSSLLVSPFMLYWIHQLAVIISSKIVTDLRNINQNTVDKKYISCGGFVFLHRVEQKWLIITTFNIKVRIFVGVREYNCYPILLLFFVCLVFSFFVNSKLIIRREYRKFKLLGKVVKCFTWHILLSK